jgi:tRNA (cmo5U34)-methyltransferase
MATDLSTGAAVQARPGRFLTSSPAAVAVTALAVRDSWGKSSRVRIPEAMVIEDDAAVTRFSEGGATQPAMRSIYDFSARAFNTLVPKGGRVLDLGVGSGHALAHFLERRPDVTAIGVDLSEGMLEQARTLMENTGLASRVKLLLADICDLPAEVHSERIDAVCSIWTLHQLPDEATLAAGLNSVASVRKQHGAAIWLLDFQRLSRADSLRTMLAATDPNYPAGLLQDALDSEAAAFTAAELREQLVLAGLGQLCHRTTVPLRMMQAAWLPGTGDAADGAAGWVDQPMDQETEGRAAIMRRAFATSLKAPLPRGKAIALTAKS